MPEQQKLETALAARLTDTARAVLTECEREGATVLETRTRISSAWQALLVDTFAAVELGKLNLRVRVSAEGAPPGPATAIRIDLSEDTPPFCPACAEISRLNIAAGGPPLPAEFQHKHNHPMADAVLDEAISTLRGAAGYLLRLLKPRMKYPFSVDASGSRNSVRVYHDDPEHGELKTEVFRGRIREVVSALRELPEDYASTDKALAILKGKPQ